MFLLERHAQQRTFDQRTHGTLSPSCPRVSKLLGILSGSEFRPGAKHRIGVLHALNILASHLGCRRQMILIKAFSGSIPAHKGKSCLPQYMFATPCHLESKCSIPYRAFVSTTAGAQTKNSSRVG